MNLRGRNAITTLSAARIAASIFGVLAGLGGITHGIGEVLQGPVAPNGIWIYSWTQGPIATNMGGEPGITIVPNLLVTGILTIIISLFVIIWAAIHVPRKIGGRILILLSVIMLLVGGGVGPPIMGILAGVAGLGINAPPGWWRKRVPVSVRRFLAALWPWVLSMGVINGVFLVIGSVILVYFFDLNDPDLFTNSFFLSVLFQLVMIFTGRVYDVQREGPHP
jgi:hypothetical protein